MKIRKFISLGEMVIEVSAHALKEEKGGVLQALLPKATEGWWFGAPSCPTQLQGSLLIYGNLTFEQMNNHKNDILTHEKLLPCHSKSWARNSPALVRRNLFGKFRGSGAI